MKLSMEDSSDTSLQMSTIASLIDLNQKSARIEHEDPTDGLILTTLTSNELQTPPIGIEHQLNNPCKLLLQVDFDEDDLTLMVDLPGTVSYQPDSVALGPDQLCPDGTVPVDPAEADLTWM